jgi:UDP-2-acetamido-2,6-beta-L-arabino-hexul-4-ose reductase
MRIGITGVGGLLGWHARCLLRTLPGVDVVACDRSSFNDDEFLERFVRECDAIFHFAGVNRGADDEVEAGNVWLAERLARSLTAAGVKPHVVYSSSVHEDRDTAYGRSKRHAGELLRSWAESSGGVCTVLVLPHVFGEGGRPFYNSVVSTFCHQLANGSEATVNADGRLELLHAQEAAQVAVAALRDRTTGSCRVEGEPLGVTELLARLERMAENYANMVIPSFEQRLDLRLFNTYRSYLFPARYPIRFKQHGDARGKLHECVRTLHGGQCFISTTKPGASRGNHFHTRKFERFAVIGGQASIRLRRLFDDVVHEFKVSGDEPVCIDMPTLHTHSIENTGSDGLVTLFWSHEFFDPSDSDTFQEPVLL